MKKKNAFFKQTMGLVKNPKSAQALLWSLYSTIRDTYRLNNTMKKALNCALARNPNCPEVVLANLWVDGFLQDVKANLTFEMFLVENPERWKPLAEMGLFISNENLQSRWEEYQRTKEAGHSLTWADFELFGRLVNRYLKLALQQRVPLSCVDIGVFATVQVNDHITKQHSLVFWSGSVQLHQHLKILWDESSPPRPKAQVLLREMNNGSSIRNRLVKMKAAMADDADGPWSPEGTTLSNNNFFKFINLDNPT